MMDQSFLQSAPVQFHEVGSAPSAAPAQSNGGGLLGHLASAFSFIPNTAKMLANTPAMIGADIQGFQHGTKGAQAGQKQAAIQQRTFGTTDQGQIAKDIIGNVAQTGALALPVGDAASLGGKVVQGALAGVRGGALAGAGNALENNQDVLKGAIEGGAAGGVFGGVAPVAGRILGLGGKAASAAGEAGTEAASAKGGSVVSKLAGKQAAKDAQVQLANDQIPFANAPAGVREDTNMNGLISMARNKIGMEPTPQNLQLFHDVMTGANGAGSSSMRQILTNIGKTDLTVDGIMSNQVDKALKNNVGALGQDTVKNGAAQNLKSEIRNILDQELNKNEGNQILGNKSAAAKIDQRAGANNVFDAIKALETKAKNQPYTDSGVATAKVYREVKSGLEDALYNNAGVNKAVAGFKLSPDSEDAIRSQVANGGGPPQLADHIVTSINDVKTGPQLRSIQEPAVRAGQLVDATNKANGGAFVKGAGANEIHPAFDPANVMAVAHAVTHPVTGIPALALGKLAGSAGDIAGKGAQLIQKALPESAPAAAEATAPSAIQQGANGIGGFLQSLAGKGATGEEVMGAGSAPAAPGASLAGAQPVNANLPASSGTPQPQTQSQYPLENMLADIQRDPARAQQFMDLYKMINPNANLTTNQQSEIAGAQKAQQTLSDYWNQLQSAGGGKGILGGNLEDIAGELGVGGTAAAARALNSQRTDVASAIAGSLSPTGRPVASITHQIADSLPSITDSKSVAEAKMQQLMQRIQDGEFTAEQPIGNTVTVGAQ